MTITIEPVEAPDGQFWVRLSMDGCDMKPHGPWSNIDQAESAAYQLAGICRVLNQPVAIGGRLLAPTASGIATALKR